MYFIIKNYNACKATPSFAMLPLALSAEIRRNLPTGSEGSGAARTAGVAESSCVAF